MNQVGYAATFSFTVRYVEDRYKTRIEHITFSCEHTHATVTEASLCARAMNRAPMFRVCCWWHPQQKIEDDAGEIIYNELNTREELEELRLKIQKG